MEACPGLELQRKAAAEDGRFGERNLLLGAEHFEPGGVEGAGRGHWGRYVPTPLAPGVSLMRWTDDGSLERAGECAWRLPDGAERPFFTRSNRACRDSLVMAGQLAQVPPAPRQARRPCRRSAERYPA